MEIRKDSWHYKLYSSVYWLFSVKPPERTNLCGYIRMLILGASSAWLVLTPIFTTIVILVSVMMWIIMLLMEFVVILFAGAYWSPCWQKSSDTGLLWLFKTIPPVGHIQDELTPSPLVVKVADWHLPPIVFIAPIIMIFIALSGPIAFWIIVSLMSLMTVGVAVIFLIKKVRESQSLQPFLTYLKDKKNGICRQVVFTDIKNSK